MALTNRRPANNKVNTQPKAIAHTHTHTTLHKYTRACAHTCSPGGPGNPLGPCGPTGPGGPSGPGDPPAKLKVNYMMPPETDPVEFKGTNKKFTL